MSSTSSTVAAAVTARAATASERRASASPTSIEAILTTEKQIGGRPAGVVERAVQRGRQAVHLGGERVRAERPLRRAARGRRVREQVVAGEQQELRLAQ